MDTLKKKWEKYLVFDSTGENKEAFSKYTECQDGIKNLTGKRDDKPDKYTKDFMKVRFGSNDNLPLNKPKKFYVLTQIVSAFLKKTMSIIHNLF